MDEHVEPAGQAGAAGSHSGRQVPPRTSPNPKYFEAPEVPTSSAHMSLGEQKLFAIHAAPAAPAPRPTHIFVFFS